MATPPDDPIAALKGETYSNCFRLITHDITEADRDGNVTVSFGREDSFSNQYGVTMGGAAVVMVDIVLAYAGYARTGLWLPTVELKTSFLAPLDVGPSTGTGNMLKTGRTLAFAEARLLRPDGRLAVHATATLAVPQA